MVVVLEGEGEGGARMALQVPPHYSLGRGVLRRPSSPEPVYSKSKNHTKEERSFFHEPDSLNFT